MIRTLTTAVAIVAIVLTVPCGSLAEETPEMAIQFASPAFENGQPIPKKFTADGEDVSPALEWSNVPEGTRELALICDDPDAPTPQPWVHWVIYKIPANAKGLPEDVAIDERLESPAGAMQGKLSWRTGQTIGYRGPAPPPGKVHRYHFRLYALAKPLEIKPGADKKALLDAMAGHVLGEGVLVGTYHR